MSKTASYFSRRELLMGRDNEYPLSEEQESNLTKLMAAINKLRMAYGKPLRVSSGYRPGHYNKQAKGAKRSAHLTCEAVDFVDTDKQLKDWLVENVQVLVDCGLYMEAAEATPGWCHVQIRPTKNRIFKP